MKQTGRQTLVLIGCGHMGRALLSGWLKANLPYHFIVVDPGLKAKESFDLHDNLEWVQSPEKITGEVAAYIFAVKPQVLEQVIEKYTFSKQSVLISIAAGVSSGKLKTLSGKEEVVRLMPNLGATVGQSMTVGFSSIVDEKTKELVKALCESIGVFSWVGSDAEVDIATAVSGSGPAYFYYLVELLAQSAKDLGIAPEVATKLATQTLVGAGAILHETKKSASILRQEVTSPNGTTAAGLGALGHDNRFSNLIKEAVERAYERAQELSQC